MDEEAWRSHWASKVMLGKWSDTKYDVVQIAWVQELRLRRTNVWSGITFQLERAYEDGRGSQLFEFQLSTDSEQILSGLSYVMHISGQSWALFRRILEDARWPLQIIGNGPGWKARFMIIQLVATLFGTPSSRFIK